MTMLYPNHLRDELLINSKERIFEIFSFNEGDEWRLHTEDEDLILFVVSGSVEFTYGKRKGLSIGKNHFLLLSIGTEFIARWQNSGTAVTAKMQKHVNLGTLLSVDSLMVDKDNDVPRLPDLTILPIRRVLEFFLIDLISQGPEWLSVYPLMEIKYKELFFLFFAFYTKREMLDFFYYHLTEDLKFSELVLVNYRKVKTANELAKNLNYSISGFAKRFKKIFGKSPYQWMQQKRSEDIYFELLRTEKSFTELCYEYNFTSPSHFNEFCKSQFGHTPGVIRRQRTINAKNNITQTNQIQSN